VFCFTCNQLLTQQIATEIWEQAPHPTFYPNVTTLRSGLCYRKIRLSVVCL